MQNVFAALFKTALLRGACFAVLLCSFAVFAALPAQAGKIAGDCTYNGIPLYGKVKIVDSFADIKIKPAGSFADIRVKKVRGFADACGEWEIVDSFPDFTVEFVNAFPDITVKFTDSFPGLE